MIVTNKTEYNNLTEINKKDSSKIYLKQKNGEFTLSKTSSPTLKKAEHFFSKIFKGNSVNYWHGKEKVVKFCEKNNENLTFSPSGEASVSPVTVDVPEETPEEIKEEIKEETPPPADSEVIATSPKTSYNSSLGDFGAGLARTGAFILESLPLLLSVIAR